MISMEQIQQLRAQTGAGIMDTKQALEEAGGNVEKALDLLRKRGEALALKKQDRVTKEGIIGAYVHMGKIGVLVELGCETDFVARTEEFQQLAKEIAMQIAAMQPLYVQSADIPANVLEREREVYRAQIPTDKPDNVVDSIIQGKLQKFFEDHCLLEQRFFKNENMTIRDMLNQAIGKMGEHITVRRFVRFSLDDPSQ